jgi:hypothetical protein
MPAIFQCPRCNQYSPLHLSDVCPLERYKYSIYITSTMEHRDDAGQFIIGPNISLFDGQLCIDCFTNVCEAIRQLCPSQAPEKKALAKFIADQCSDQEYADQFKTTSLGGEP